MSKKIFITGTNTEVGKTYVTALLIKQLVEKSRSVTYFKAVLSGAVKQEGKFFSHDAEYVKRFAGLATPTKDMVSYVYEYAASPHLSAQMTKIYPSLSKIVEDYEKLAEKYSYIVVEGSGGIVCPLSMTGQPLMLTDVIKELDAAIIIVVPAQLGAINSAVLTSHYAEAMGIKIKGFILNFYHEEDLIEVDNKKMIELLTGYPVLGYTCENSEQLILSKGSLEAIFTD